MCTLLVRSASQTDTQQRIPLCSLSLSPDGSTRSPARSATGRPRYCRRNADQGIVVVVVVVLAPAGWG